MLTSVPEVNIATGVPDRLVMVISGLSGKRARSMALMALQTARQNMPKLTGAAASRLQPIWGKGYFGVRWADPYVWYQEQGIQPFTMKSLAGKTIPMWIDDPTGAEKAKNPKAQTRTTESGRRQILIFRRAANPGETKTVTKRNKKTGLLENKIVSKHYPGAPGRIVKREHKIPLTTAGKKGGQIAKGNGGVWWRHPGLTPRQFLNNGLTTAAQKGGILPQRVYAADANWKTTLHVGSD